MTKLLQTLSNTLTTVPGSAALGSIAGVSLGFNAGWLGMQIALAGLMLAVLDTHLRPQRAANHVATFVVMFVLAGHWEATLGAPSSVRAWAICIDLAAAGVQAGIAGVFTFMACTARLGPTPLLLGTLPTLWVLREWLSQQWDWSIPWQLVGYAQAPSGPLSPLFPLGGVLLVSWACVALAAALALAWRRPGGTRRGTSVAGVMVLIALPTAWPASSWTTPVRSVQVQLLQSGVTSAAKDSPANQRAILEAISQAVSTSSADLLVSSQLAIPKTIDALPTGYLSHIEDILRSRNGDAVLGLYAASDASPQLYNAALSLGASGPQLFLKHRLFPFGEYLPLGPFSGPVRRLLDRPVADMLAGPPDQAPILVAGLRASLAICYESAFGDQLRQRSHGADLLINMASDSALDAQQLARQFKQIDQARVLELQKPLLRTSDIRGTFMLNHNAQVVAELAHDTSAALTGSITGRTGATPYARWGDAPVLFAGLMAAACCAMGRVARRHQHGHEPGDQPADQPRKPMAVLAAGRGPAQRGQVLPIFLVLLTIVLAVFYFMVNSSQAVTEKTRLTNAADAAAYSAALVEARALNFDAYMNRAIVANQLSIAQMVSLASWIDYFGTGADHVPLSLPEIGFFMLPDPEALLVTGVFTGTEMAAAYFGKRPASYYAKYLNEALGVLVTAQDVVSNSLALVQLGVRANLTLGYAQGQAATQVVQAIDPAMTADVLLGTHGFDWFTKIYSGEERERLRETVDASRPPATRERNWTICSFDIPFLRRDGCMKKRSGTEIGLDNIVAMDTLELHGRRFGCGRFGMSWCDDIKTPLSWGAVRAGERDSRRGYHGGARVDNPTTARRADAAMHAPGTAFYSGMPAVHDLRHPGRDNEDATTGITIRVAKRHADLLTTGGAAKAKPTGPLRLFDAQPMGGEMVALSRGEVFFDRIADRADGKTELASLYNPYWRVRLVQPLITDKLYVGFGQGAVIP